MAKMNLQRAYTHSGKDYGPGEVDVPDEVHGTDASGKKTVIATPASDIAEKEAAYQSHLDAGGEKVAPVTPSVVGTDNRPQNATALQTPSNPSINKTTAPSLTPVIEKKPAKP